LADAAEICVRISDEESRAFGLTVGRLDLWPPVSFNVDHVFSLIEDSGLDLVILRVGADNVDFASQLHTEKLISWQADTLLYFEIDSVSLASADTSNVPMRLSECDELETDSLVQSIFEGYRNHYSANPLLERVSVVAGYQDWVRRALASTDRKVFKALTPDGSAIGLCVVDMASPASDEVLLAGIIPEERGRGAYQTMLSLTGREALALGKSSVVISTQAANVNVMRAWCRLGFLPQVALNTFHVVRRDTFQASLGDAKVAPSV